MSAHTIMVIWVMKIFFFFFFNNSSVYSCHLFLISSALLAQTVKSLPVVWEIWVRSLGGEDPLEKEMATHSSILGWKIPQMEKHGRLQSMGSQRVGHDWATSLHFTCKDSILLYFITEVCQGGYIDWNKVKKISHFKLLLASFQDDSFLCKTGKQQNLRHRQSFPWGHAIWRI